MIPAAGTLFAQSSKHLNPVIEKLAAGKPFIGVQTGDLSLENARALARADIDYVYLEMEHGPMDFDGLHRFTVGMIDKASTQFSWAQVQTCLNIWVSRKARLRWSKDSRPFSKRA
jgi:hypothetical protein